jgi:choline dehydrogenase-like flavoprotein
MAKTIKVAKQGLKVTQAADFAEGSLTLLADAVVVGSGAGGAISAYELARAGKKVIVLEAGPYVPSEKFSEMLAVAMGTLYQDHGGQNNTHGDIAILQGRCVGGSTVVNAALCFRTPDYYLDLWAKDYGLTNLTPDVMRPYFEKVEKNLHITEVGPNETSPGAELLKVGMKKLGHPEGAAKRNIKDCALTGFCFSGCVTDRKQSMLVTYLPWAVAHGAEIFADTRVTEVLASDGKATGVRAEVIDPATGAKKADVQVDAPLVVMAAGPIQTPLILQKSGLANSSGQVGKNFACHPTMSVTAEFPQEVNDFHGATHSLYMDQYTMPEEGGYILLNAVQEPVEAGFQAEPGTGKPYVAYMSKYRNTIRLISLIHDKNVGEVKWEDGNKAIHYEVDDEDFENMKKGLITTCNILFASGAKKLYLPSSNKAVIERAEDVEAVIGALKNQPARYKYTSFHPQGTCRMGADPKTTVVSPTGETHDVKNLYVADASLLPTSIGYNPSETVYALAHYINDQILKAHRPEWVIDARNDVSRVPAWVFESPVG